jgi:hypothetical protein
MQLRITCGLTIALCLAFQVLLVPSANAQVIYVRADAAPGGDGSSWGSAFLSISDGIAAATPGAELWIAEGTYPEAVVLSEGITLYGGFDGTETAVGERDWEANSTVIDAFGLGTSVVTAANNTVLDGLTVTGGSAVDGGGIKAGNETVTISNCTIVDNEASDRGGGVFSGWTGNRTFSNCVFAWNRGGMGGGIFSGGPAQFTNCVFAHNTGGSGGAVNYLGCGLPDLLFYNCIFYDNHAGGAGVLWAGAGAGCGQAVEFSNCTVTENVSDGGDLIVVTWDIYVGVTGSIFWNNSLDTYSPNVFFGSSIVGGPDPLFVDPGNGDFHLQGGSPAIDTGGSSDLDTCMPPGLGTTQADMGAFGGEFNCWEPLTIPAPRISASVDSWSGYR